MVASFTFGFFISLLWLSQQPVLLDTQSLIILVSLAFTITAVSRYLLSPSWYRLSFCILGLTIGLSWGNFYANHVLSFELGDSHDNQITTISGHIHSLPEKKTGYTQFSFVLETQNTATVHQRPLILLKWYGEPPEVLPASCHQFQVKLKKPRGLSNLGGFDYEAWLFQKKIRATGYVKKQLSETAQCHPSLLASVNFYRNKVKQRILNLLPERPLVGVLLALSIGDRSELNQEGWKVLQKTGTAHLIAISGLHVGLASGFVYFALCYLLLFFLGFKTKFSVLQWAAVLTLIWVWAYCLLVGFTIPTRRAAVIMSMVFLSVVIRSQIDYLKLLSFSVLFSLVLDPFSLLSTSFWLSFGAVVLIMLIGHALHRHQWNLINWMKTQLALCLGLIPLNIFFFGQFSLVAILANSFAIPWISFVVLPGILLAMVGLGIPDSPLISQLLQWLHISLEWLWYGLESLSDIKWAHITDLKLQLGQFCYLLLVILLGVFHRLFNTKGVMISLLVFSPWVFIQPRSDELMQLTMLDVGQGLAIVIDSPGGVTVYDTGAAYRSGFNMGQQVLIPFLKNRGIKTVNTLIVSHGDNDHIGGARALLDEFEVGQVISGNPEMLSDYSTKFCQQGHRWQSGKVRFEVLSPLYPMSHRNNNSCVIHIHFGETSILLAGDIEKSVERSLVKQYGDRLASQVLLVPHHGSMTSSTPLFVNAVKPHVALVSAGYKNRFRLPREQVVKRYQRIEARVLSTAEEGAVTVKIPYSGFAGVQVTSHRKEERRFWHSL